jgi:hypothetical protein
MAAPNIVEVNTILGKTNATRLSSTSDFDVISTVPTNYVYKINTVMAANITTSTVKVTLKYLNAGSTERYLAKDITIPTGSSIALLGKDTPIYLEESEKLIASSDTSNGVDIISSFETITT